MEQKAEHTPRILIAGPATVTAEAAEVFASAGICLLGNESQTVGPENAPMQVHKILLEKEVALLGGERIDNSNCWDDPCGKDRLCTETIRKVSVSLPVY